MLNRLRRTEHPDGSEELFTPDAEGNRVVWERENNQRLEMDYDPLNRLIETRRVPAAGDGIARVNRIYDGNGNLTRVEEHPASGAPRLWIARYDDFNRRIEWTDRNGLTVRQRFDASDNRIERTGPEGSTTYTYNALDQLQGVTPPPAAAPTVATVSKAGRLLQLSHANGSRTEVSRDGAGRAVQLRHALGAAALLTLSYTLDANGHRVAETWERGSEVISIAYELDLAERLKAVTTEGQRIEYTLDENGNRTAEILPGGLTRSHAYDNRDRLITTTENGQTAATYAYDLAGRQITHTAAGVTRQFDYDTQDRLLGVTQNGTPLIRYEVDAFGQRTLRDAEGQVEQYQWDGTRLAGRTNATGTSLGDYQYAYGWAISSREGGVRSTLHTDVHGTPQLTTDPTAAILGWTRTDVWGVEKASSGAQSRIGHTGYLKDPLLADELYAQARQYRAGTGRFTSRDEWVGDHNNPITLNKYLYGNGNPGSYTDPDGRCAVPALCALGFAQNDEQRVSALRSFANTDPALGLAVGGAVRAGQVVAAPVIAANTAMSALEGDPSAQAAVAEAMYAAGNYAKDRLTKLATEGVLAVLQGDVTQLGTGIGESAAEAVIAGERGDYVGQGMAVADVAGQAASVLPAMRATSVARSTLSPSRAGSPSSTTLVERSDGGIGGRAHDEWGLSECCARCFGAGTLVMTADGLKPIEGIVVGQRVMARDEVSGKTELRTVEHVIVRQDRVVFDLTFADGEKHEVISVTADHRFHTTERGWVVSGELQVGEAIESLDGRRLVFESRSAESRKAPTFNLSVNEDHNYFVGESGLWVHNCTPCGTAITSTTSGSAPQYRGGAHREMSGPSTKGDGLDSHHMPDRHADPAVSAADGPAIQMDPADHHETSSNGQRGASSTAYRLQTAQMIADGNYRGAMAREILDVRRAAALVSGVRTKYNTAIKEMLKYARESGQLPEKSP